MSGSQTSDLEFVQTADDTVFVNQIQRAMARAIDLVVYERRHHSFCVVAPKLMSEYKQVWLLAFANQWKDKSDEEKAGLRRWFELIELNEDTANRDIKSDFESAKRRTIILLADLFESYVESILQLCAVHSLKTSELVYKLTGKRPKSVTDPLEVKRAIRSWERTRFPDFRDSRSTRLVAMITQFMPLDFKQLAEIDSLLDHRNALTHEIVQIGELNNDSHRSANAASLSLEKVDNYFNVVGNFIIASMEAFKRYKPLVLS